MNIELLSLGTIITTIIIILTSFIFGENTLNTNTRHKKLFTLMIIMILIWTISILITDIFNTQLLLSLFMSRISFASTIAIVLNYYFFIKSYENNFTLNKTEYIFLIPTTFILFILSFTPLILKSVIYKENKLVSNFGRLYYIFTLYILTMFILSLYKYVNIYRKVSNPIQQFKIKIILIGTTLSMLFALTTNLLLPIFFNIEIRALGPLSLIFFIVCTYYAIIKYNFLTLKTYLLKITHIFLLSFIPYMAFFAIYFIQTKLYKSIFSIEALITGYFMAIFFVYLMFYLNFKIKRLLEKFKLIPISSIAKLQKIISIELDINKITQYLFGFIHKTLNIDQITIIKFKQNKSVITYNYSKTKHITNEKEYLKTIAYKIWKILAETKINELILDYNEISILESVNPPKYKNIKPKNIKKLQYYMKNNKIYLIYFLKDKHSSSSILVFLGNKTSGKTFTLEDINILHTIMPQIKLSIDRALLYEDVKNFNKTLQAKIDEATKELTKKNIKLQETLRREREMLDILGHELRTPLTISKNAVLFMEQQIKEGTLTDDKLNKYLSIAIENLKREANLVETLLSTTKIDNKSLDLTFTKVDIIDVVNDSFEIMIPRAKKKNLKLTFTHDKEVFAYADRNRTQEIVDNLIDNAIKYTIRGEVKVNAYTRKDKIYVEVIDTGVGISKEDLKHIGKKFYRTNTYVKSSQHKKDYKIVRPGGTGLGLYVTFNLAKAMNGEVTVESELDKGSKFTLILPKYTNQKVKHTKDQESTFEKFKRLKKEKDKIKNQNNKNKK